MTENNFDKIKKLMKIIGGKAIVVEDGKPMFVIINVDEYIDFKNTKNKINNAIEDDIKIIRDEEKVNKDINIWKSRQDERKMKQIRLEKKLENNNEIEKQDHSDNEIVVENL
ncbi:MAG: hypothetical protein KAI71_06870 [Candidatus Pacebacteria bacterium]|nr:hypothetical protein [Candidatus Paceibacterota bacterium]